MDNPQVQFVRKNNSFVKAGFTEMLPKYITKSGKLVDIPFYKSFPIGTRVKFTVHR